VSAALRKTVALFACVACVACGSRTGLVTSDVAATDSTGGAPQSDPCGYAPWPMNGRCANRRGRSDAAAIATPRDRWSFYSGFEPLSPVIGRDGTIYVADGTTLHAVTSGGDAKWSFTAPATIWGAPAVDATDTVYIVSSKANGAQGTLIAVANGAQRWSADVASPGFSGSPAIAPDGTIYVAGFAALQAFTSLGEEKWSTSYPINSSSGNAPAVAPDGTIYVTLSGLDNLVAFDAMGATKWTFEIKKNDSRFFIGADVNAAPAVGDDGRIYIASGQTEPESSSVAFAVTPGGSLAWKRDFGAIHDIESVTPIVTANGSVVFGNVRGSIAQISSDGTLQWSYETGTLLQSGMAAAKDGTIYVPGKGGLIAIGSDGTPAWMHFIGASVNGSAPAIAADGAVIFGTDNGQLLSVGE
jgi:hypothetical protein